MSVATQLKTMIDYLEESEQQLVLEIVKRFLPNGEVMPYDEYFIRMGEMELESGNVSEWTAIDWK